TPRRLSLVERIRPIDARPVGSHRWQCNRMPQSRYGSCGRRSGGVMSSAYSVLIPAGSPTPAFIFDLDGTLIDSVYQHVLAWREALEGIGLSLAVWRIHRRIGMSGGLLAQALGREIKRSLSEDQIETLQRLHAAAFERHAHLLRPLSGASAL